MWDVSTYYGWCALAVCGAAWLSGSAPIQKVSAVLFGSWIVSNVLSGTTTPPRLLVFNSLSDFICMGMVTLTLIRHAHKRLLFALITLYAIMIAFHFAWLWYKIQVFRPYFTALNILYALQLVACGSAGVHSFALRFADRPSRADRRNRRLFGSGKS